MKNNVGFTLMEIMIIIAILGILTGIATPNIIQWLRNSQFNASVREVKSAIEDSRLLAVKNNKRITLDFTGGSNSFSRDSKNYQFPESIDIASSLNGDILTFNTRGFPIDGSGYLSSSNNTIQITGPSGLCSEVVVSPHGSIRISECP